MAVPAFLKYMIEYGLGVQTSATYAIRRVDYDFFSMNYDASLMLLN